MWDLTFSFTADSPVPLFKQIIGAIAEDITRGRLQPGDALPGTRKLATQLGVHRNTVVAAYEGLISEGWLLARPAGGTYVADTLPDQDLGKPPPQGFVTTLPEHPGFPLRPVPPAQYPWQRLPPFTQQLLAIGQAGRDNLSLASGICDWRLFPNTLLARALRQVMGRTPSAALTLGDPQGHARTRAVVATMLAARRNLLAKPENILITRGNAMNLRLLVESVVATGEAVAVEDPGYPGAWEAIHQAGARLVPIQVDRDGLRVKDLAAQVVAHKIRAVYVTPHHQYPTTAVLSVPRRLALLRLAAIHGLMVIEDDYDHEFRFEGQPVKPLASMDPAGQVAYLGSLSKLAAPGLRLGFVAGPQGLIKRLTGLRINYDLQGERCLELAIASLAEEGEMGRHVRKVRSAYQRRRDVLVQALRRYLPGVLDFEVPQGGVSLWARLVAPIDVEAWAAACQLERVRFFTGRRFDFGALPSQHVRFCYASLTEQQLEEAARRMGLALDKLLDG